MTLKNIIDEYPGNIFDAIPNVPIVSETNEWRYYDAIKRNAIIGAGWLANDDIFFVNSDGEHIFGIAQKAIVYENTSINRPWKNLSDNNLQFHVVARDEHLNFFGLRGGDGNHLTKDSKWKIEIIDYKAISKLTDEELINSVVKPKDFKKVTINTETGSLFDGNTRIYELQRRGLNDVKVPYQEYTPDNSMFPQLKEPPPKNK